MTPQEIEAFLAEPHIAHISVVHRDGSPHVSPVWYHYDRANLLVVAEPTALKVRCIKREPRVSVSIATAGEPYCYVQINGRAQLSTAGAEEALRKMALRYKGPELGTTYVDRIRKTMRFLLITITPIRTLAWTDDT